MKLQEDLLAAAIPRGGKPCEINLKWLLDSQLHALSTVNLLNTKWRYQQIIKSSQERRIVEVLVFQVSSIIHETSAQTRKCEKGTCFYVPKLMQNWKAHATYEGKCHTEPNKNKLQWAHSGPSISWMGCLLCAAILQAKTTHASTWKIAAYLWWMGTVNWSSMNEMHRLSQPGRLRKSNRQAKLSKIEGNGSAKGTGGVASPLVHPSKVEMIAPPAVQPSEISQRCLQWSGAKCGIRRFSRPKSKQLWQAPTSNWLATLWIFQLKLTAQCVPSTFLMSLFYLLQKRSQSMYLPFWMWTNWKVLSSDCLMLLRPCPSMPAPSQAHLTLASNSSTCWKGKFQ